METTYFSKMKIKRERNNEKVNKRNIKRKKEDVKEKKQENDKEDKENMKENNKKRKSLKIISQDGDIKTKKEIKVEIGRLRKMKV